MSKNAECNKHKEIRVEKEKREGKNKQVLATQKRVFQVGQNSNEKSGRGVQRSSAERGGIGEEERTVL